MGRVSRIDFMSRNVCSTVSFRQSWADEKIFGQEHFPPTRADKYQRGKETKISVGPAMRGMGSAEDRMDFDDRHRRQASWRYFRQGLFVVPRHPPAGVGCKLVSIAEKNRYVFEGIDFHEVAGMDEAHEQVSNPCASFSTII